MTDDPVFKALNVFRDIIFNRHEAGEKFIHIAKSFNVPTRYVVTIHQKVLADKIYEAKRLREFDDRYGRTDEPVLLDKTPVVVYMKTPSGTPIQYPGLIKGGLLRVAHWDGQLDGFAEKMKRESQYRVTRIVRTADGLKLWPK